MLGFVRARVPDLDAEELFQRACAKAAEKIDTLQSADRVRAWFYRILRNTINDELRSLKKEREYRQEMPSEDHAVSPRATKPCRCAEKFIEELPAQEAEILRLSSEVGVKKTATNLGISPSNAGVRLHRARAKMRKKYAQECGVASLEELDFCAC